MGAEDNISRDQIQRQNVSGNDGKQTDVDSCGDFETSIYGGVTSSNSAVTSSRSWSRVRQLMRKRSKEGDIGITGRKKRTGEDEDFYRMKGMD